MEKEIIKKKIVETSVKDKRLIQKRRAEIIKAAAALFKQKGFHGTTTREIAASSGFSIGTLYEYIRTKEDILYLVCDSIFDQVKERLEKDLANQKGTLHSLKLGISYYYHIVDEMQTEFLVMYQETKSLSKDAIPYVLQKETEMVSMFKDLLTSCVENGELHLTDHQITMIAHTIFVQGQMWGFRRWALQKHFTLAEYIELQTELLFTGILG